MQVGSGARDVAIHRISRETIRLVCSLTGSQWIATGYVFAMTRLEWTGSEYNFVIARKERSEGRGNPSCLGGDDPVSLFVYCNTVDRHGLRPRDDKM